MQKKTLTLFELNSLVRDVVESSFSQGFWVEAELSEAREVRGHCYLELIQKDLFSPTPVARASAKCWKSTWMSLRPKFERITGQPLHAGMKALLLVTANFHEAYGFSWIVQDIDPTYTMGDMARKRQEIIQQLKLQGIFDMQRELQIPMFAQRVAVISSENAAGYGDFCHQLEDNDYGLKFYPRLFPAIMQGDQVEPTVIAALNRINLQADDFDVVVIIRGGGATADMSGFDTLALAENVANFPLPVITGIGHDRDESILDMISNTRVKTPTAAAAFLVDNLAGVWTHIENCQNRITTHVNHRMDCERHRLDRCAERIPMLFSMVKARQEARLDRLSNSITSLIQNRITRCRYQLQLISSNIRPAVERRLTNERHHLRQLDLRLQALDPEILLKRGYSITLHQGRAVRNADDLLPGDEIETHVEHGTIHSVVK
ncbi:MAG: exodeoxyribonuclease VII large subunit [Prevotella sp.]|nr:exodeoxyribonuclease VII large subunit [Prevotella sp.]